MRILSVPDMSCEHCVKRISACLDELELSYEIDLEKHEVTIDGCDNCVAKAIAAMAEIGYDATPSSQKA